MKSHLFKIKDVAGIHHYISCKDKEGEYFHYEVAEPVYIYIKQLEAYIRDPDSWGILKLYPERFKNAK